MSLPPVLRDRLRLPVIGSPLFIVSGAEMVIAQCKAGVVGSFPSLNARPISMLDEWLHRITEELAAWDRDHPDTPSAPFAVNQIVHKTNNRLEEDVELCVKWKAPVVITSLGARTDINDAIHAYGGVVLHDVITDRFARKAVEKGADGLIPVAAGAGGHAGLMSPFAMVSEIRQFFSGAIILSGVMSHGSDVAAARAMGADFAYMGTRFIATHEAMADQGFKEMIVESDATDIVYTPAISGVNANFLRPSIAAAGRDPDNLTVDANSALHLEGEAKVWKDIWSAGQGVGGINDILSTADLCARLAKEYRAAIAKLAAELDQTHTPTA